MTCVEPDQIVRHLRLLAEERLGISGTPAGELRSALEHLATSTPQEFEKWWRRSKVADEGPIDVIDFFSGCGGMSAGFRAANGIVPAFKNVLAVDIDRVANRTYASNLGLTPQLQDVGLLADDPEQLANCLLSSERRPGHPLVMIGCAPCQGFSSHRAANVNDGRNALFVQFCAVAIQMEPDFIVIENVPELCTDRHWAHVEKARAMFEEAGYRTNLAVHNFATFGLPQERFRAVMVAARTPYHPPAGFLTDNFRTVRQAIGALPAVSPGVAHPADPMHLTAGHRPSTIETIRRVPKDGGKRAFDSGPPGLIALQQRQGKPGFEDVYGRLHWDRPAITITHYARNPASGRFVHPEQDRGLSIREAAVLQGFPQDYRFEGGLDDSFRQIGNAVPPLVACHLAVSILAQLLDGPKEFPEPGIVKPLGKSFARMIPALKYGGQRKTSS